MQAGTRESASPPPFEFRNLQALRGIAVTLVVLLHLGNAEFLYGGRTALSLFSFFGAAGVDLFFVISGFVMATITRGRFQRRGSAPLFLFSRAARIYPPYWVVSLALLAAHGLFPALGDPQRWRDVDVARSLLLLPQVTPPILIVAWTLVLELYFYLVVAVSLLLAERLFVRVLLGWAALLVLGNAAISPAAPHSLTVQLLLFPLAMEFIAGCLVALLVQAGVRRWATPLLALGAALLPALYAAFAASRPGLFPPPWWRVALFGLPSALMVYGACGRELTGAPPLPRLLVSVGDRSYSAYLTHVPVIVAVSAVCSRIAGPACTHAAVAGLVRAGAVAAVAMGCYAAVERPLHRAARAIRRRLEARCRPTAA